MQFSFSVSLSIHIARYQKQARAHYRLQNTSKALDVLARALRRKDLENDTSLVDDFIAMYTGEKGFLEDETAFRAWLTKILVEDEESKLRLVGVGGEWQRRVDAHLAQWSGIMSPTQQYDWRKALWAIEKNEVGVNAFSAKDRNAALKAFTEAIEDSIEVLSRNPDSPNHKTNLAILYCNRASTWLLGGSILDADAAVRDTQIALTLQPASSFA
jgi:tetratricopeptide (TPR) repeat protein